MNPAIRKQLRVPRILSTSLTSRLALPGIQP
jgi:hypothetical protein